MTKNERIAALESRMAAAEGYIRAAGLMDAAPVPLAVGDTVEVTGPSNAGSNYIGLRGKVVDLAIGVTDLMYVQFDDAGIGPAWFPASSLRRVQPAPDVQPAAYVAGQAVECDSLGGKVTGQFVCELDPGFYAVLIGNSPIDHRYRAADIRPCPASAGCVVQDVQTGRFGEAYKPKGNMDTIWVRMFGDELGSLFDPARHAVMLTPRQPAAPAEQPCAKCNGLDAYGPPACECNGTGKAPAEQPTPPAYCPKCHHALGQADKHGCKCAAPAEQPDPDLRREIEAALNVWNGSNPYAENVRRGNALRAAAAVPPNACGDLGEETTDDATYNAGQDSILAPMLAELKGATHEQR